MKCSINQDAIWSLVMGDVAPKEKQALEQHVSTCESCRQELAALQQFWKHDMELVHPEPPAHMRGQFIRQLNELKLEEARKQEAVAPATIRWRWWQNLLTPQFKTGWVMLVMGVILTTVFFRLNTAGDQQNIQELSAQVKEMKEMMALTLLEHPSASERLRAVSMVNEIDGFDSKLREALLTTLEEDENVNVRLTALESLSRMTADAKVREGLIQAISHQESPIVQAALADVMLQMNEKKAVKPLQRLLKQPETNELIKPKLRETISKLS